MKQAKYFERLGKEVVRCTLCPHYCIIPPNSTGICKARKNFYGVLYSTNYAQTVTISIDPIEKKPLYHFDPGQAVISLGSNSCNFSCDFCQNYSISQFQVKTVEVTSDKLLDLCRKHQCRNVAFTYTEPITWFEYVLDSAKLLKSNDINTIMVTNGFINEEPLRELLPYIDAMNIDLKAYNHDFYEKYCHGKLEDVLRSIEIAAGGCHLEITNLLITDLNDSIEDVIRISEFIASIDKDIPLHLSKYFPHYKMHKPQTPESIMFDCQKAANEILSYVYLGNVITDRNTYCPNCEALLVNRVRPVKVMIRNERCPHCGHFIKGKFE